jgi:hypothetical protein
MILLYSIFASSVMLGGLVTAISIIRGGHTDTSGISSLMYTPEDHS